MKIRTLVITAASVIAFSSSAMADTHLFNAEKLGHGLFGRDPDTLPGIRHANPTPGKGSPFAGADQQVPASRTIEEGNPQVPGTPRVPDTIIKDCTGGAPCVHVVP